MTGSAPTFVDLFAGCGGLSLGLMRAGWRGLFAIEKSPDAFSTLSHNLVIDAPRLKGKPRFDWPCWLPQEPMKIGRFISSYREQLAKLAGRVTLIAGGPPCQGFSFAGRRQANDPRNQLFKKQLELVDLLKPEIVFLENVRGISIPHGRQKWLDNGRRGRPRRSFAERIRNLLDVHGYDAQQGIVRACDYGVPQLRPRYLTVGIRREYLDSGKAPDFFAVLSGSRKKFLEGLGLSADRSVSAEEAISDLRVEGKVMVPCVDPESPKGFRQISYLGPETDYQVLMHEGLNGRGMNSLRLPNHHVAIVDRFRQIHATCRKGVQLSSTDRERLGIKKSAFVPLAPDQPSHTLTTLPDDLLHYAEPRIHTVREHARLQSFPDWFDFRGKYTTGGDRRTRECPRYTQVGNAVPPLLAEAVGQALLALLAEVQG